MNILSTIHTKYQGETMFCFVCVATVFGYILGVNRVIDAIISKHSDERRCSKVVNMIHKYTQTNFGEIAELLASNNLILSSRNENDVDSSDQGHNSDDHNSDRHDHNSDHHDHNSDDMNDDTSKVSAILNSTPEDDQEQEKQMMQEKQENAVMSPSSISSVSSISTSEEDYELVRKNENSNHSKNKNNVKYFEWLNIF
jgi:hypothetical protein